MLNEKQNRIVSKLTIKSLTEGELKKIFKIAGKTLRNNLSVIKNHILRRGYNLVKIINSKKINRYRIYKTDGLDSFIRIGTTNYKLSNDRETYTEIVLKKAKKI